MIKIIFRDGLEYLPIEDKFSNSTKFETIRYLKGVYTNKQRFLDRYVNNIELFPTRRNIDDILTFFENEYDNVIPFSYKEAFEIESPAFKAMVFGSIDITEMITEMGATRLKVEGIPVKRKQFDINGDFTGYKEYDNIYETYEVDGTKLELDRSLYAVKCWCTSTNKEHWLWIEEQYKDSPKDAIASTFRIHENLVPYIKELKRQGDVLLVELTEEVEPEGNIITLNSEQYFSLLTTES